MVLIGALIANLVLAILVRGERTPFWLALAAFILIGGTLVIFFTWTYPANQATDNWTIAPGDWEALRTQWEYAHAANALLTFVALCCVTFAALLTRD